MSQVGAADHYKIAEYTGVPYSGKERLLLPHLQKLCYRNHPKFRVEDLTADNGDTLIQSPLDQRVTRVRERLIMKSLLVRADLQGLTSFR